jgi:transaldolase
VAIIWASTREVLNVIEADAMGCHIITAPLTSSKRCWRSGRRPPAELSLSAVKAFRDDALAAGLTLEIPNKMHAAE